MMVEADSLVRGNIDNSISQSNCVATSKNNKTLKVKEESNVREGKENELMSIVSALLSLKTMGKVHEDELEQKSKAKKRKKTVLVSSISSKNDESCPGSNTGHVSIKRSPHCRSSWVNKTIRVPATNLKGADKFSWRSNGTKQLVGLSHLRRYYRCSYKGCSVHKIVDQDPNDPSMLIVNYNGEHNHAI
ncbi:putative WRKY transcription factor 15 [Carex rostrata]